MNERIKELESQCWEPRQYGPAWFNAEKFAELIVQDNIRTLRGNGYDDAAQCLQDTHFGIEHPV
jgi:hypothetical protein